MSINPNRQAGFQMKESDRQSILILKEAVKYGVLLEIEKGVEENVAFDSVMSKLMPTVSIYAMGWAVALLNEDKKFVQGTRLYMWWNTCKYRSA